MNRAMLMALASMTLLSFMDAGFKKLSLLGYSTFQNVFLRFAISSVIALVVLIAIRPRSTWAAIHANVIRSVFFVVASVSFFYGLSLLPFAEAVALAFLAPLFIAVLGALQLGETITRSTILALIIGFTGMLVMVSGRLGDNTYSEHVGWGVASVIFSAFVYAVAIVLMRARAQVDAHSLMVFIQNIVPVVTLAIPAYYVWKQPPLAHAGLFLMVGVLGIIGHYLLVAAFARAEASKIAPLEYTHLFWAVVIGYLWFGEIPSVTTMIGAIFILAGVWATGRK